MRRTLLFLVLFACSAAWAGAQHGSPDAAKRLEMLAENRTTIEILLDRGLDLAGTSDYVERVDESRKAADALRQALADAADTQDPDRVVELGEHLSKLFSDGLVPTLNAAAKNIPEWSPSFDRLKAARRQAAREADSATALDLHAGRLAASGRVKDVSQQLVEAAGKVKAAAEPKK
ncbi:MAG TPA: hypothetical protein VGJ05_04865 [Fimbriiglobus sp.]